VRKSHVCTRFLRIWVDSWNSALTLLQGVTAERLLQGPFSDAMTHAGQLALLRRLAGSPVPPENFHFAAVHTDRLGLNQAGPARPDQVWREAPPGWVPPAS
jgi:hypothetical protein